MAFLTRISVATLLLVLLAPATWAADPFYESLLREGQLSYERGDLEAALIELELACFGLLEEPQKLATGLTYLGIVEGKSGRRDDFEETFRRVLELEERFGAYSSAQVEDDIRSEFESYAQVIAPRGYLASNPAFAHLAVEPEEPETKKERKKRLKQEKMQLAEAEPPPADQPEVVTINTSDVEAIDTRPLDPDGALDSETAADVDLELIPIDIDPASDDALGEETIQDGDLDVRVLDGELSDDTVVFDEDAFNEAASILASARTRDDLNRAMTIARPLADDFPEHSGSQHLVARIAYMGSSWADTVLYYERGGASADPEMIFYSAVSYFELGRLDRARENLELALPNLTRTDYVNVYIGKILEDRD